LPYGEEGNVLAHPSLYHLLRGMITRLYGKFASISRNSSIAVSGCRACLNEMKDFHI
jgi:hypothetical protein